MISLLFALFFALCTSTIYCADACVELISDKSTEKLAIIISKNNEDLKDTLLVIEDDQQNPQSNLDTISSQIDYINSFIEELIISQSVVLKSFNFADLENLEDFLSLEELNQLYEEITYEPGNIPTKTTIEELENTLAQLQVEITLLESQIADLRIQIENFILTNEQIIFVAIQETALLQLRQNEVPGLDFEAIFDGVKGFEEAIEELGKIMQSFYGDLTKIKKYFWDNLYKKPKKQKRIHFINFPGIYNITKNINNNIIINSDNVIINLNGHEIYADSHTPLIITKNHKNIIIKNGSIRGNNKTENQSGILIHKGTQLILIEEIVFSCCRTGIRFNGKEDCQIQNCKIRNCTFDGTSKNIALNHTQNILF